MNVQDLLSSEAAPECPPSPATSVDSCSSDTPKRGWVAPFLLHLHQMLRREDPRVIRWSEDGMAFQILDKEAMTTHILPKYFKNKNFSSFQRQLNYFGFRKWSKARAQFPTYSREHFTRDNFSEMSLVKRQSKKSRKRKAADEEQQPAKRAALAVANYGVEKCKPILPRPGTTTTMAAALSYQPRIVSPPMHPAPVFSLPDLSPTRKLISGYKLPSIRELSLSSALPYTAIGSIRPRLMA
ncbi:HSF-type DNA-binding protein, putative [Phytophthora infestans T30-4]|uniref:HSF-type DNA-binding protein, putative n=2 Tax=Phytophthora infestans TaxID=4787 RepID=D0MZW9_PHYIT|nr:HSF-type DNA-binding protein, putative [Phytophthora infestans T30-4]KAF4047256.1 HSF-type DNA-binding [Phytophthora infestans]EEY65782.1 HSF-type DNA-binding protein, putative [Phytophthora infestans T30-4]KAF4139469.1 HSF-type DNA-binding [Phytophthora infestans]KAI9988741.1 hypothetical protein PInf_022276 [Phytophthora infestans]KAI9995592.1 hypothetical protein PInf_012657 [Phytophthora infestans]|eukprot:XP_002906381.1 HSF-type DNA-binding protein, putative [Phytophthora infestans T30-4]